MKVFALAAASAAVIGVAACSHAKAPSAAPDGSGKPIAPVSCGEQYRTWTLGEGKGLMGALNAVSSAASGRDPQVLTAALKQARPAVASAAKHPIPACADPRGYWSVLLMHVNAAVASTGSASSARVAMQDVPKIHHQLVAEVKQTAQ